MPANAMKRRLVTAFQRYVLNPVARPLAGRGPGPLLLETTGRRSGRKRTTPVGGKVEGDTVWIVAEHGRHANYVRNIEADPKVRVRVKRSWRSGTAQALPGDDPRARLRQIRTLNSAIVGLVGTDLLTVRIALDPEGSLEARA